MTGRLRALGRDLVVYGLGEVAVKAFGFITLPVYTRFFAPQEYGIYGYLTTLVGLASAILILGGDSAYARFFFAATSVEERRRITTTWIVFLGACAALALVVAAPFSSVIAAAAFDDPNRGALVLVAVAAIPAAIVNRMLGQVLRNQFRPVAFTALNIVAIALTVLLSILGVAGLNLGIIGLFIGALAAELLMLPVRLWAARAMFEAAFSTAVLRQLLSYGLPLVPMSIAYWVFLTSDRIVLAQLSSLEQVGLYSVAVTLVSVPSVAISAVGQAWSPHAMAAYETDREEARQLVARMGVLILAGFGLLAVGITAFAPEVLAILSTSDYAAAAEAVPALALAMAAQASTNVTALGISLVKRTSYLAMLAWAAAGVNLALNLVLDGPLGMIGAAWATTGSFVALTVGYQLVSQRLWHVPWDRRAALVIIVATTVFTLAAPLIVAPTLLLTIVVKVIYCLAFVLLMVALGIVDVGAAGGVLQARIPRLARTRRGTE